MRVLHTVITKSYYTCFTLQQLHKNLPFYCLNIPKSYATRKETEQCFISELLYATLNLSCATRKTPVYTVRLVKYNRIIYTPQKSFAPLTLISLYLKLQIPVRSRKMI